MLDRPFRVSLRRVMDYAGATTAGLYECEFAPGVLTNVRATDRVDALCLLRRRLPPDLAAQLPPA